MSTKPMRFAWHRTASLLIVIACQGDPTGAPGPPVRLLISEQSAGLLTGEKLQLRAVPLDAWDRVSQAGVEWKSSDSTVVGVGKTSGLVTAIKAGRATITAGAEDVEAFSVISVIEVEGKFSFVRTYNTLSGYSDIITYSQGFGFDTLGNPAGFSLVEPEWSPDGAALLVSLERRKPDSPFGSATESDIAVVADRAPSSTWRVLTNNGSSRSGSWSPDGRRIVYVSGLLDKSDIYVISIDGGASVRLSPTSGDYYWPRWSPDGTRISFTVGMQGPDGYSSELRIMNADGSDVATLLRYPGWIGSPTWLPDSRRLTFDGSLNSGYALYMFDVASRAPTSLVSYGTTYEGMGAVWSHDGSHLLHSLIQYDANFQRMLNGPGHTGIYLLSEDASSRVQLTKPGAGVYDSSPTWRR